MFSCNLRCRLIFLHGRSRTYRVASLHGGPVGRISYNLYFVRYVTCDLINEYSCFVIITDKITLVQLCLRCITRAQPLGGRERVWTPSTF